MSGAFLISEWKVGGEIERSDLERNVLEFSYFSLRWDEPGLFPQCHNIAGDDNADDNT